MLAALNADTPTPLAALRSATREHHHRIDSLLDVRTLAGRGDYVRVLQGFDAFLPAWEQAVLAALPRTWHPWLERRSRRPFLAQDLRALRIETEAGHVMHPPLATAAAAWGSLYVMEGSALGGQVITRVLAGQGLHAGNGAAYFHGWGEATGRMWREFRELLERELRTPAAVEQACDAACLTFQILSGLMEGKLHERAATA